MKKFTTMLFAFICISAFSSFTFGLTQYCHKSITATDGTTKVYLTCKLVSTGNYQIKIESDAAMTALSPGCYCNINGVGGNQLIALPGYSVSSDGKTITVDIPSTSGPNLYTPLYILMSGEKNFPWPTDVDWTSTCSGGTTDSTPPSMVSASVVGTPTFNSATLSLSATDDVTTPVNSFIANDATNGITNMALTTDASGNVTLTGLKSSTAYNLTITAQDGAGNVSTNSKSVSFTTAVSTNTECSGTSTEADQGSFTNGYNYTFTTSGTDVTFTCELLDTKTGLVAYAWTYNPNFAEAAMTNVSGQKFTKTFSGQTIGATFKVACKFAFSGGMSVTKTLSYTVGNSCSASTDTQAPTSFTATAGTVGTTSIELLLNATDDSGAVSYSISYGSGPTVLNTSSNSGVQKSYIVTGLIPATAYTFSVTAKDAAGNVASNSPITVDATTLSLPKAPTPTVPAAKVISIYSDAYTSVSGVSFTPNWGQSTVVTPTTISGDNVLIYSSFNYMGVEIGKSIDASSMTKLHVDVYPTTETVIKLSPISTGPKQLDTSLGTLTANQWNSFDIPLSTYTGVDMADLFQFIFSGGTNGTFYMDNLYLYNETTTGLNPSENSSLISLYPSAVSDKITVSAATEIKNITVRNIAGQSVRVVPVNADQINIDMSNLSSGNYFVTVKFANGESVTRKIIKL